MPSTWQQFKLMAQFFIASIVSIAAFVAAWRALDLPVFATERYVSTSVEIAISDVNKKFSLASEDSRQVKAALIAARLQLNKINRQSLEAEKYRLTQQARTTNSFEVQQRLRELDEQLEDANEERKRLLGN